MILLAVAVWQMAGRRAALRYVGSAADPAAGLSIPFLILGPLDYLTQLPRSPGFHEDVYGWNIWVLVRSLGGPVPDVTVAHLLTIVITLGALLVGHPLSDVERRAGAR